MPSEGKESDPTWQDPMNFDWGSSADEDLPIDQEDQQAYAEYPPLPDSWVDIEQPFHAAEPLIEESDVGATSTSASLRDGVKRPQRRSATIIPSQRGIDLARKSADLFTQLLRLGIWEYIRQYLWLIGIPLLFGGCTCLIVLPLIALQRAAVPPAGLWPVTFVIIVIAVAQGFALYKAGTNTQFWMLGTLGGFFLFILVDCFVIFGLWPALILSSLLVLTVSSLSRRCLRLVPDGYVDLVSSFGKYRHPLYAGFNIIWPWEEVTHEVDIQVKQWTCSVGPIPLSSTRDVMVQASISYQLLPEGAHLAAAKGQNWEQNLQQKFQELTRNVATTLSVNDVIAWQRSAHTRSSAASPADSAYWWDRMSAYVLQRVQDEVIQWCVQVNDVHIAEVSLVRHHAPIGDAGLAEDNTGTIEPQRGTTSPMGAAQSQAHFAGPSPEEQKNAARWLQETKEEIAFSALEKSYNAVYEGRVKVPETIRDIANKFDAVARDPQKSKVFKYDAARAAHLLYKRAQEYEELEAAGNAASPGSFYDDTTATMRRPSDGNIMY